MRTLAALLIFTGISLATGYVGSIVTGSSLDTWYLEIRKPVWTPPSWVFPVVWTSLFVLMGVSAWRVWAVSGLAAGRVALTLFAVQLLLNFMWSVLFFGMRSPGLAMLEILVLILAIGATTVAFSRHDLVAAGMMAPYLLWTSFAAVLNFSIWRMN